MSYSTMFFSGRYRERHGLIKYGLSRQVVFDTGSVVVNCGIFCQEYSYILSLKTGGLSWQWYFNIGFNVLKLCILLSGSLL